MIVTERLVLRPWEARDLAPFAALNADAEVMRHFPARLTRAESDGVVLRLDDARANEGITFDAVERRSDGAFLGMVGLSRMRALAPPVDGLTQIGWRLNRATWGQGYAQEAARAWLDHGFRVLGLPGIVAFTARANLPSQRVMERIGMTRAPDLDFDHPRLPPEHPLRRQLVWRIAAPDA